MRLLPFIVVLVAPHAISFVSAAIAEEASQAPDLSNPCEVGECVPYYLCTNGTSIITSDGILDIDLSVDSRPEVPHCSDLFETCCTMKSDKPIELRGEFEKSEKCGFRQKKGTAFEIIERDNEAQFGEFPWVMAVIYRVHHKDMMINVYKCGGTLIHPKVVMTAAHCVVDLPNVKDIAVRAGEWDTITIKEPYAHQDRNVIEAIAHEDYKPGSYFNDMALLFLETEFELATHINTACLPPQDFNFDHKRCYATGWGKDKFGKDGNHQVILKKVELPVVPSDVCEAKLRDTRLGKHFNLDPSFICAGGEKGKDTCSGDGGSPLSCEIPNSDMDQYYIAGTVAWGIGCFDPVPGVYVAISKFRHWVDTIFDAKNIDKKFYTAY